MDGALDRLRRAFADEAVRSISRRYFVSNGFDGALTSVGVIVGAFVSGVPDGVTVVQIGVGAAIGLGTSGVWSVWEIERAERQAEISRLERAMLADLDDTRIQHEHQAARAVNAVSSGLGPVVGVLVPLLPFLLEGSLLTMAQATLLGVGLAVAVLFAFGAYMGSVAGMNWYVAGLRMGLAGVVVALVNLLLSR